jgi:glycosyltransferase involved in cell wall biosynthesis
MEAIHSADGQRLHNAASRRCKHIAFFLKDMEFGGVERLTLNLATGLVDAGFAVDFVLAKARGSFMRQIPQQIKVVDLGASRVLFSIPKLARYLKHNRPDWLVLANNYVIIAGLWAARLSRAGTRTLAVDNGLMSKETRAARRLADRAMPLLARLFFPWADVLASASRGSAADLARTAGLPLERIALLYNPTIAPGFFDHLSQATGHAWLDQPGVPVILGVGRLTYQKDFHTLLRAFQRVRMSVDARLIILGEGEDRSSLVQLAKELGVSDHLDMPGFVANPAPFMAKSSVFALSSRWENLPLVVIEALASGCQIAATDCGGGIREILHDGVFDDLVEPEDPASLADLIVKRLQSPATKAPSGAWMPFTVDSASAAYREVLTS